MYHCKVCNYESNAVVGFTQHMKLHSNSPNCPFACGVSECSRVFRKFAAFKSHLYRDHKSYQRSLRSSAYENIHRTLICQIEFCQSTFTNLKEFVNHLKSHIQEGRKIKCPFRGCEKEFGVKSTFSSHISRTHRNSSSEHVHETFFDNPHQNMGQSSCTETEIVEELGPEEALDTELFLKNLSLFYLKLQAKLLLPASVIQTIIEEFQDIYDLAQSDVFSKLKQKLSVLGVSNTTITNVIEELKKEDVFRQGNCILRTDQRRKTVFKTAFNYVEPQPLYLGANDSGKECFAQYVPVKETLGALFESDSFKKQYAESHSRLSTNNNVLEDIWDGQNATDNALFKSDTPSLALILYQDAFEVVNPLGSGRKKHKVLAVYLTLGNILPHNRSNIDHMQLVLLCREQDIKYFGQEKVFSLLIKDLQDLEDSGIVLRNGSVVRGAVCAIAGDNLGSHSIGGFLENFSRSTFFCRFCDIDRQTFESSPLKTC
ncbi:hypothetical protein AMEX_G546, partial [Astyanax mexicanus]